jgi:hypothetical protein
MMLSLVRLRAVAATIAALMAVGSSASDLQLGLYLDRKPTADEVKDNFTGAKLEPLYGCYLGAFIDLDYSLKEEYKDTIGRVRRLPSEFERIVGTQHSTYFFYLGYGRPLPKDWVGMLAAQGKIVHIALEPTRGIQYVLDDEYLATLAKDMGQSGAKILLRFGSEMNGAWVEYGRDPRLFKEKFKLVAKRMRQYAPNVAMVWCPYATPVSPIDSYYPGDDWVDWVGVNMYSVTYFDQDRKKPAGQVHPMEMLDYVYKRYSARKPVMIGEYGTTHFSALEKLSVPQFAERNLYALYAGLPRKYPRVKCISYFNGNNLALEHRLNNNYAVTQDADVLKVYRRVTEPAYYLKNVSSLSYEASAIGFLAVDGTSDPMESVPVAPMPLQEGDVVQGKLDLSAWCKTIDTDITMKFRIDGKLLYERTGKDKWYVTIGTTRLTEGWKVFSVEAWKGNKMLAKRAVGVTVVH